MCRRRNWRTCKHSTGRQERGQDSPPQRLKSQDAVDSQAQHALTALVQLFIRIQIDFNHNNGNYLFFSFSGLQLSTR